MPANGIYPPPGHAVDAGQRQRWLRGITTLLTANEASRDGQLPLCGDSSCSRLPHVVAFNAVSVHERTLCFGQGISLAPRRRKVISVSVNIVPPKI